MLTNLKNFCCIFLLLTIFGCAGANGNIRLGNLKYPASMSAYLYGPNKEIVVKGKELKVVSNFLYEKSIWGIMYTAIPLTGDLDDVLTNEMNEAVINADGDGIINVAVTAQENCGISRIPVINWLPIWPGRVDITVNGEIVKIQQQKEEL